MFAACRERVKAAMFPEPVSPTNEHPSTQITPGQPTNLQRLTGPSQMVTATIKKLIDYQVRTYCMYIQYIRTYVRTYTYNHIYLVLHSNLCFLCCVVVLCCRPMGYFQLCGDTMVTVVLGTECSQYPDW